jgi:hypothetical protein
MKQSDTSSGKARAEREKRLAEALRANLRRRKDAGRSEPPADSPPTAEIAPRNEPRSAADEP